MKDAIKTFLFSLMRILSPGRRAVRPVILMYHSIDENGSPASTSFEKFSWQMGYLKEKGYQVIGLDKFCSWFEGKCALSPRSVLITFDDGYRNNFSMAFPLLRRLGFPAAVFVLPRLCGKFNVWRRKGVPLQPLMGWKELKALKKRGITIGAHSMTHSDLSDLPPGRAWREIAGSKSALEKRLKRRIRFFAYPRGKTSETVKGLVKKAGFSMAFGILKGNIRRNDDPYDLRRVYISERTTGQEFIFYLSGAMDWYTSFRARMRNG